MTDSDSNSSPDLPRKKPSAWWIIGGVISVFLAWFFFQLFGPSPAIVVSKETTYITEPLRADGLPDYERYWRERAKDEVTSENNAVVLLLPALWPGEFQSADAAAIAAELGFEEPLNGAGNLVYVHDNRVQTALAEWLMQNDPSADASAGAAEEEEVSRADSILADRYLPLAIPLIDQAIRRPWTSADFPPLAKWVADNEQPLDQIVAASKRSRYYMPSPSLIDDKQEMLIAALLPGIQTCREISRAVPARAMWNMGEGRPMEAWNDLFSVHRLAQLMAQDGHSLIEQLVAMAIAGVANDATVTLLDNARLTPEQARQIQNDLASLAVFNITAGSLGTWERVAALDAAIQVSRDPYSTLSLLNPVSDDGLNSTPGFLMSVSFDWNEVLRHLNGRFDELVTAANAPDRAAREAALAEFGSSIDRMPASLSVGRLAGAALNRTQRSEMVSEVIAALFLPSLTGAIDAEDRVNVQRELLRVASALAVYRAENGQYPDMLDALVPGVLPAVPVDLFHGSPFIYRRDDEGYLLYTRGENGTDDGGSNRLMRSYQGRSWDELSDEEWAKVEAQTPGDSDDFSIRTPRETIEPPTTPGEVGQ